MTSYYKLRLILKLQIDKSKGASAFSYAIFELQHKCSRCGFRNCRSFQLRNRKQERGWPFAIDIFELQSKFTRFYIKL